MGAVEMIRIPADPTKPVEKVTQEDSYEVFRAEVGGYIEAVRMPGAVMWVNEDGWVLEPPLPLNERATFLAHVIGYHSSIAGDVICVGYDRTADTYHDAPAQIAELAESLPTLTKEEERGR